MTTIASAIFVLGVLIFIHELGHFIMAKRAGIKVEKFSLGFPPAILSKKIGETEYCIGLIPLGGFVKMAGENPDEAVTGAANEFMSKSVGARTSVVLAGPVMNFLLAWVILWGLYFARGEAVVDPTQVVVGMVTPGGPAATAGLQEGDIIKSINGTPVTTFPEMAEIISANPGREITIAWEHNGVAKSGVATTIIEEEYNNRGEKIQMGRIGVGQQVTYESIGLHTAAWIGLERAGAMAGMVFKFLYDVVTLQVSAKMIGGPVFIAQMAGQTAQAGLSALLFFIALLSVNLAVLNVLPIPVLDGGHLMFLLIEKLRGSPLTMRQRTIAQQVGLVFLLLLIVWVTYNDIMRFVTG